MAKDSDKSGLLITVSNDSRITKAGRFLRKYRLDELPQLLNIITGDMSFVGTRPEVPKYVRHYTHEMMATLLLPAGVTSSASIMFIDEEVLLCDPENTESVYINQILPQKMRNNLLYLAEYSAVNDLGIILKTIKAVFNRQPKKSKFEVLK